MYAYIIYNNVVGGFSHKFSSMSGYHCGAFCKVRIIRLDLLRVYYIRIYSRFVLLYILKTAFWRNRI